jgi:AraC-like DNA-binding protein
LGSITKKHLLAGWMTLAARYLASRDCGQFLPPHRHDFSIYSFKPTDFWYSKTSLPLSKDTEVLRYNFSGRVRFKAGLNKAGLQIIFIDNHSTTGSHLQGMGGIDSVMMISIKGHDWDGLSDAGALGIKINFGETIASKILNRDAMNTIQSIAATFGANKSLVLRLTPSALELKGIMLKLLKQYETKTGIAFDDIKSTAHISTPINLLSSEKILNQNEEILTRISQKIIQELHHEQAIHNKLYNNQRRSIALKIEELLWKQPKSLHLLEEIDLDYLAELLDVSRRTIQVSVQEQFGVGFIDLRRTIRLYQIRTQITKTNLSENISTIVQKYFLTHPGRFSRDYKKMFGILPSVDARKQLHEP